METEYKIKATPEQLTLGIVNSERNTHLSIQGVHAIVGWFTDHDCDRTVDVIDEENGESYCRYTGTVTIPGFWLGNSYLQKHQEPTAFTFHEWAVAYIMAQTGCEKATAEHHVCRLYHPPEECVILSANGKVRVELPKDQGRLQTLRRHIHTHILPASLGGRLP